MLYRDRLASGRNHPPLFFLPIEAGSDMGLISREQARSANRAAFAIGCSLVAALVLTSCVEIDPIGVTLRDGAPAVQIIRCEPVESVSLVDSQDSTLWRVRAPQGVDGTEFAIGIEPLGFTTEVPFRRTLDPLELLTVKVQVSGDRYPTVVQFHVRDLREGDTLFDGRLVGRDEFLASHEHDCNARTEFGQGLARVGRGVATAVLLGLLATAASFGVLLAPIYSVKRWRRRKRTAVESETPPGSAQRPI